MGKTRTSKQASDLKEILRPALTRIGDRLAQLIVALDLGAANGLDLEGEVERALRNRELDADELDAILRAIATSTADAE